MPLTSRISLIAALSISLSLGGCGTNPPSFAKTPLSPGSGRIVVYRIQNYIAMFAGPSLFINGNEQGKVYPGNFYEIHVAPGEYEVGFAGNFFNFPGPPHFMSVSVEADRPVYIELSTPGGGGPAVVERHYYIRTEQEAKPVLLKLSKVQTP